MQLLAKHNGYATRAAFHSVNYRVLAGISVWDLNGRRLFRHLNKCERFEELRHQSLFQTIQIPFLTEKALLSCNNL